MGFADGLLTGLLEISEGLNDWLHQSLPSWSLLDAPLDEKTLVAIDGSLVSAIRVDGMYQVPGAPEFQHAQDAIGRALAARLAGKDQAHTAQAIFHYDPNGVQAYLDRFFAPSIATMRRHGLDIAELMDDWKTKIGGLMAVEDVWFVLWTHPQALVRSVRAKGNTERNRRAVTSLKGRQSQSLAGTVGDLSRTHKGFLTAMIDALRTAGLAAETVEAAAFLRSARMIAAPERTSPDWVPRGPGGKVLRARDPTEGPRDYSALLPPSLRAQILPLEGQIATRAVCRTGRTLHLPLLMHQQPEEPLPFAALFRAMLGRNAPWRVIFTVRPDGLGALGMKGLYATTFSFTSHVNRRIANAIRDLKAYQEAGGHILRLQTLFDTWATMGPEGEAAALDRLESQAAEMTGAVQGWGTANVTEAWGAPDAAFVASIPGATPKSPAPLAAAPLADILRMLPITRPAMPWTDGSVLFRAPDGKPMPYAMGSGQQAAWVEVGAGQQGAGKSVMINTLNWAFLTQPGLQAVPFLSIVDFGASSAGLIRTLQDLAPEHLRPYFLYQRLKLVSEHAINPFDTGLGCVKPLPRHRSALINLLSLIATPDDANSPEEGSIGLAGTLVDAAYARFAPGPKAKVYVAHVNEEIDLAVGRIGLDIDRHTTWWEITDALFGRGDTRLAAMAQRYAMPLLGDLVALANDANITSLYSDTTTKGGETLTGFFMRRAMEAQAAYPVLAHPTELDLGVARVISLDLDEVAPKGGRAADRQASIMFMLARHVLMGRFFVNEDDLPYIPEAYRDYHHKLVRDTKEIPKRWVIDEGHRMMRTEASSQQIVSDLETATRESRKLMLQIGLYSQSITDTPASILNLSTSVFLMNAGSEHEIREVNKIWPLTQTIQDALRTIRPPDARGATFLGLFRTKGGFVQQLLTNTLGPLLLTAFESRAEDRAVRDRLYKLVGVLPTLRVIAKTYPGGIKPEADRRKTLLQDRGLAGQEAEADILSDLVEELAKAARGLS